MFPGLMQLSEMVAQNAIQDMQLSYERNPGFAVLRCHGWLFGQYS
jgi:hypothetical protein